MITQAVRWIEEILGIPPEVLGRVFISLLVLVVLWVIRRLVLRVVLRDPLDLKATYNWDRGSSYVFLLLAALIIGPIWVGEVSNFTTYFGLVSAGIAIALKDPVLNFFGWLYIIFRRPFQVGDRIQLGSHAGDVTDVGLFQFSLLEMGNWVSADQHTGRVVHIPNGKIFLEAVANYSEGLPYIWNEVSLTITFESDWETAKSILQEIAKAHAPDFGDEMTSQYRKANREVNVSFTNLRPAVYTNIQENGVGLTSRYLCKPTERRATSQAIIEAVLREFRQRPEIEIAYPTHRLIRMEAP